MCVCVCVCVCVGGGGGGSEAATDKDSIICFPFVINKTDSVRCWEGSCVRRPWILLPPLFL